MSDATLTEYLIELSRRRPSKNHVLAELKEEIPVDSKIEEFVEELWERVHGGECGVSGGVVALVHVFLQ